MRSRASAAAGPAEAVLGSGGGGTVFVTVGTTKFDALVAAVDDPRVAAALVARGFRRLIMQARRVARPVHLDSVSLEIACLLLMLPIWLVRSPYETHVLCNL